MMKNVGCYEQNHADTAEIAEERVMTAIDNIEQAHERWRQSNLDPSSSSRERDELFRMLHQEHANSADQWANVKMLLATIVEMNKQNLAMIGEILL
jgi:hypothetical protein